MVGTAEIFPERKSARDSLTLKPLPCGSYVDLSLKLLSHKASVFRVAGTPQVLPGLREPYNSSCQPPSYEKDRASNEQRGPGIAKAYMTLRTGHSETLGQAKGAELQSRQDGLSEYPGIQRGKLSR